MLSCVWVYVDVSLYDMSHQSDYVNFETPLISINFLWHFLPIYN